MSRLNARNEVWSLGAICFLAFAAMMAAQAEKPYPAPRYPQQMQAPKSAQELMPVVRNLVRQAAGRTPLGLMQPGQRAVIFGGQTLWLEDNYYIIPAIVEAFRERQIEVQFVLPPLERDWIRTGPGYDTQAYGHGEGVSFIRGFSRNKEILEWIRVQNPKLYAALWGSGPEAAAAQPPGGWNRGDEFAPADSAAEKAKLASAAPPRGAVAVLEKTKKAIASNPNITVWKGNDKSFLDQYDKPFHGIYTGTGGRPGILRRLGPLATKFNGNFVYNDYKSTMSNSEFPGDVWRLVEERTLEPLGATQSAHFTDPEGSDLSWDVTPEVAKLWLEGAYLPGHLFMFPHGAGMIAPNPGYPTIKQWVGPLIPNTQGILAGTMNSGAYFPRIEIHIKNNMITEVRGGGYYGEIFRTLLKYPPLQTVQFPIYDRAHPKPVKGYFQLYEGAYGTTPKSFPTRTQKGPDRDASGIIHFAFGMEGANKDAPSEPGRFDKFREQSKDPLPGGHGLHVYNQLSTLKLRIRGTDRWVSVAEKGRLSALDHPEVRALAASYGDPNEVLYEVWRPDIPGVNSPGSYEDYAKDPWKYKLKMWDGIDNGTYPFIDKRTTKPAQKTP